MAARLAALIVVALFASGAATGFEVLSRLGYAVLGFLVLGWVWSRLSVRDLELMRSLNGTRFAVGELVEEQLTTSNPGWWPVFWAEVREPSDLPGHRAGQVVSLGPRGSAGWAVRTECRRRGRYVLGPLELRTGDPFGLFPQLRYAGTVEQLVVYPRVVPLEDFRLWGTELAGGPALARWTQQITPNAAGIRDYLPGDSFNRMHWPSTARLSRLMVKEFEPDPTSDIWIVLDLDREVHVGGDDDGSEEYAVTVAASLAMHFLQQDRAAGLVAAGQRFEVIPPDRGDRQVLRLLEELALLRAEGRASLAEVLNAETVRFGAASTVLIITPSVDVSWVSSAQHVLHRGLRVAVILLEPSTFGPAPSALHAIGALASAAIPTLLLKRTDQLEHALAGRGEQLRRRHR